MSWKVACLFIFCYVFVYDKAWNPRGNRWYKGRDCLSTGCNDALISSKPLAIDSGTLSSHHTTSRRLHFLLFWHPILILLILRHFCPGERRASAGGTNRMCDQ